MSLHRVFFYLLVLLLPTQLGYHFWPSWAMVLGRRIDYLSPTLFVTDIIILFIIIFWGSELLRKLRTLKRANFFCLVGSFIFVAGNIAFASSPLVAFLAWVKVLEFFLLGWYIVTTKPPLWRVTSLMLVSVLYSSLLGIVQFVLQHSVGGLFWFLGERTFGIDTAGIARIELCNLSGISCRLFLRSYATFPHPNVFGGFLAVTIPLFVSELFTNRQRASRVKKYLYLFAISLGVLALVLTFSRSAWVVAILILLLLFFKSFFAKKRRLFFVLLLLSVCLIVLVGGSFHGADESVVVRTQLNHAAVKQFVESPIFGVGARNFLVKLPESLPSRAIYFLQPTHNIYLLMLSEIGLAGVLVLAGITLVILKMFRRVRINHTLHYVLCGFLALGLVDHYPITLQQGQILLTMLVSLSLVSPPPLPSAKMTE